MKQDAKKLQTYSISQADKAKEEIMDTNNNEQQCNWHSLTYGEYQMKIKASRKLPDEESWKQLKDELTPLLNTPSSFQKRKKNLPKV